MNTTVVQQHTRNKVASALLALWEYYSSARAHINCSTRSRKSPQSLKNSSQGALSVIEANHILYIYLLSPVANETGGIDVRESGSKIIAFAVAHR